MHPFVRIVISAYLVLAVLAGVPAGASGTVLCVATDGHIAFEVGDGRCADEVIPAVHVPAQAGLVLAPLGCDRCIDLPVGRPVLSEARNRSTAAGTDALIDAPRPAALLIIEPPTLSLSASAAPEAASHPAAPPSRTTILRN